MIWFLILKKILASKREVYDLYGEEGLKNQLKKDGINAINAQELFEKFFGTSNPFAANSDENGYDMNGIYLKFYFIVIYF